MARRILHLRRVGRDAGHGPDDPTFLDFCRATTPLWELTGDGALLDVSGTERLYGPGLDGAEQLCRRARGRSGIKDLAGGTAPTVLAARLASSLAARSGPGVFAVGPGNVEVFLARFSVRWLPAHPGELSRLKQLGVRTFGDLQATPRTLLKAVFGERGVGLADEASGRCGRILRGEGGQDRDSASGLEIVAGVRLDRPLAAGSGLVALRRGLALRAVALRHGGMPVQGTWRLTVLRPGGGRDVAHVRGSGRSGWSVWTGLLDLLWERLPRRRVGLLGAELHAAPAPTGVLRQDSLFPEDDSDRRLALVLAGIRRGTPGAVAICGEELLAAWGARWYGPGEDISGKGRGLVDGAGR